MPAPDGDLPAWSPAARMHRERRRLAIVETSPLPATLKDCPAGRCPHLACRHNLAADVDDDEETCVLRVVARRGALTLEEVGDMLGVCRERIRQVEKAALRKLATKARAMGIELEAMFEPVERSLPPPP